MGGNVPERTGAPPLSDAERKRQELIQKLKDASKKPPTGEVKQKIAPYGRQTLVTQLRESQLPFTEQKQPVDRERLSLMLQLLKSYIEDEEAPIKDFADAVHAFQRDYGQGARELDAHFENAWTKLKKFYPDISAAGSVADVLSRPRATESQDPYDPASERGGHQGSLVPKALSSATREALENLKAHVGGSVDDYIEEKIDDPNTDGKHFLKDQVDALAMAISNVEKGSGTILGDQTGMGKGRVVAGMIKYGIKNGRTVIFVTEKANLYSDIYRDLIGIGMKPGDIRPLMTNADESIPLNKEETVSLKTPKASTHNAALQRMIDNDKIDDQYNMIFTTYTQLQTRQGNDTVRRQFVEQFGRALPAIGGIALLGFDPRIDDQLVADGVRGIERLRPAFFHGGVRYVTGRCGEAVLVKNRADILG